MINLTDKHSLLKQFKDDQLNKTLTMFDWSNLPDTLPMVELEKMLQINGYAVIAKFQGKIYAFQGGFRGQDAYNQPTQITVNNPALHNNTTYTIDQDCIVIKNDDMKQGLLKTYEYYGQRLIENEITMLMTDYNLRMPFTISSSDDQTTQSAKEYLNKIIDGSLGVIGEQKLFKALSVTPTNGKQTSPFADLYGYQQFMLAQLNNTIGLATNNNMKRERLTTNEIEINKNASYPFVDNMLRNRQQAVEKINKMFDLNVSVEYSSIWGVGNAGDDDSSINDTNNSENDNLANYVDVDDTTSDDKVNNDERPNGNGNNDNSSASDDKSNVSGAEQSEAVDTDTEPRSDENGKEAPQPDNAPVETTRKNAAENEVDGKQDSQDGNDGSDSNDENDQHPASGNDNVPNDDDDKKKHDGKGRE